MVSTMDTRRLIVQTALRLGEQAGSWDGVHVHAVACEAGIPLDELNRHFGGKDEIAEGFFDLADEAMLANARQPGWAQLRASERLYRAITAWLDVLAPHKRLVRQMLGYKLQPEHIHLQVRGVARISRTVQWFRETAMLPATGWRRELEEAVLTSIYLATFSAWLMEPSGSGERSKRLLRSLLQRVDDGVRWVPILR
jgi:ubiquinone biosynthesis protein COQ9